MLQSKKNIKKKIFAHEKLKKLPKKVAHNSQPAVFFITCQAAQKAHFGQKLEFYWLSVPPLYNLLGRGLYVKLVR